MDKWPCEKAVAVLNDKVEKLERKVDGNGKDGLCIKVDRLERDHDQMIEEMSTIARAMNDMAEAETKRTAVAEDKERRSKKTMRIVSILGGIVAVALSLDKILTLISKLAG